MYILACIINVTVAMMDSFQGRKRLQKNSDDFKVLNVNY